MGTGRDLLDDAACFCLLVHDKAAAHRVVGACVQAPRRRHRRRKSACRSDDRAGWSRLNSRCCFSTNATGCSPSRRSCCSARTWCRRGSMPSISTLCGSSPSSPSMIGLVAAVPLARGAQRTIQLDAHLAVRGSSPRSARPSANIRAAFIGPTVCELDGPMPILKRSNTLTVIISHHPLPDRHAARRQSRTLPSLRPHAPCGRLCALQWAKL